MRLTLAPLVALLLALPGCFGGGTSQIEANERVETGRREFDSYFADVDAILLQGPSEELRPRRLMKKGLVPRPPEYERAFEVLRFLGAGPLPAHEESERRRDGAIPGSMHLPYGQLAASCDASGPLRRLGRDGCLVLYCAVGERSTLAVEIAAEHGVRNTAHIPGGFRAWRAAGGPVETVG